MEKNKGITLVALVITIIVLLILAGVTIFLFIGDNGIIEKAKNTKIETNKSAALEKMELKLLDFNIAILKDANRYAALNDLEELVDVNSKYYDSEISKIQIDENQAIIETDGYQFIVNKNLKVIQIDESDMKILPNNINVWLKYAGIENKGRYNTLDDVLQDITTVEILMNSEKAIKYMLESSDIFNEVLEDQNAMKELGKSEYGVKEIVLNSELLEKVKNSNYPDTIEAGSVCVPKMTSNTAPYGIVSGSAHYQNGNQWAPWAAFSRHAHNIGSGTDGWYAVVSPAWIQYEFEEEVQVYKMKIYAEVGSSYSNSSNLLLKCSTDGINYQDVSNIENYSIKKTSSYYTTALKKAKYWKLTTSQAMRVYDLQFYAIK